MSFKYHKGDVIIITSSTTSKTYIVDRCEALPDAGWYKVYVAWCGSARRGLNNGWYTSVYIDAHGTVVTTDIERLIWHANT